MAHHQQHIWMFRVPVLRNGSLAACCDFSYQGTNTVQRCFEEGPGSEAVVNRFQFELSRVILER